jgi:hypothetical protein
LAHGSQLSRRFELYGLCHLHALNACNLVLFTANRPRSARFQFSRLPAR